MGSRKLIQPWNNDISERGKNINRQIIYSFLARAVTMVISFIQVPLLLKHLGEESYGVWLTILSVVSWFTLLDIGVGNGLRNKLAESISLGKLGEAKEYVSTAYISLSVITLAIISICGIIIPLTNWQLIFNTSNKITNESLTITLLFTIITTLIGFVLVLITQVLNAIHKSALSSVPNICFGILFVFSLNVIPFTKSLEIKYIAILYSIAYVASYMGFSVFIYQKWNYLKPELKYFNKRYVKDLLFIGIRFFIIQVAVVVIFSTDNFIITRLFGPAQVTSYNITFRLFSFLSMLITIVMTPLWSAYTDAYAKKEYNWIKEKIVTIHWLFLPLTGILVLLVYYFDSIVNIWLGENPDIPKHLPLLMAVYVLISTWNNIYAYFLNGISKTREQMATSIIAMFLNIPLSIYLGKYLNFGPNGVIIASIICLSFFAVIGPITTYKTLNRNGN